MVSDCGPPSLLSMARHPHMWSWVEGIIYTNPTYRPAAQVQHNLTAICKYLQGGKVLWSHPYLYVRFAFLPVVFRFNTGVRVGASVELFSRNTTFCTIHIIPISTNKPLSKIVVNSGWRFHPQNARGWRTHCTIH